MDFNEVKTKLEFGVFMQSGGYSAEISKRGFQFVSESDWSGKCPNGVDEHLHGPSGHWCKDCFQAYIPSTKINVLTDKEIVTVARDIGNSLTPPEGVRVIH